MKKKNKKKLDGLVNVVWEGFDEAIDKHQVEMLAIGSFLEGKGDKDALKNIFVDVLTAITVAVSKKYNIVN